MSGDWTFRFLFHNMKRIIICDDWPISRFALRELVSDALDPVDVVEVDQADLIFSELSKPKSTDLIVYKLARDNSVDSVSLFELYSEYPDLPVIIVSDTERAVSKYESIAAGYITKSTDIGGAIRTIRRVISYKVLPPANGETPTGIEGIMTSRLLEATCLTRQQVQIALMLSQGLYNKQIAFELSIAESTVKGHITTILQKLGVKSRTQAAIAILKIVQSPDITIPAAQNS